jgi:hypothetical protein
MELATVNQNLKDVLDQDIAEDLLDILQNQFIDSLVNVKSYNESKGLRSEYLFNFEKCLDLYSGANKEILLNKLKSINHILNIFQTEDQTVKEYMRYHKCTLIQQALQARGLLNKPIGILIFTFMLGSKTTTSSVTSIKCNESHMLREDDWDRFMSLLTSSIQSE